MKFLLGWEYKMYDEEKISEQHVYFQFSKLHGKSFKQLIPSTYVSICHICVKLWSCLFSFNRLIK